MSGNLAPLAVVPSRSLPSVIRDEIVQLILCGAYSPGAKLGEEEIAGRLGVSRGPVREAFRSLEEIGLVHLSKNRGVFVRQLSAHEARELYVVRRGIDELVGRLLAPQITAEQVAELRDKLDEMEVSVASRNVQDFFRLDFAFHDRVAQLVGNAKLLEVYRRIVNEMQLVRMQSMHRGGGVLVSNHEHSAIVDALASRDGEAAARAMGGHVAAAFERVAPLLPEVGTGERRGKDRRGAASGRAVRDVTRRNGSPNDRARR